MNESHRRRPRRRLNMFGGLKIWVSNAKDVKCSPDARAVYVNKTDGGGERLGVTVLRAYFGGIQIRAVARSLPPVRLPIFQGKPERIVYACDVSWLTAALRARFKQKPPAVAPSFIRFLASNSVRMCAERALAFLVRIS